MPGKAVTATVNRVWVEGSVRRTVRGSARTKTLEFSVLFWFFGQGCLQRVTALVTTFLLQMCCAFMLLDKVLLRRNYIIPAKFAEFCSKDARRM